MENRLDALEFLSSDNNVELVIAIRKSLRNVKYLNVGVIFFLYNFTILCFYSLLLLFFIQQIFIRMQQLQATVGNWISLYKVKLFSIVVATKVGKVFFGYCKTVYNCVHIGELLGVRQNKPQLLNELSHHFNSDLQRIGTLIGKIVI